MSLFSSFSQDTWEAISEYAFGMVIIGVSLEVVDVIHKWIGLNKPEPETKQKWPICVESLSVILVVLGLAVELFATHRAALLARSKTNELQRQLTEAQNKAVEADKEAAEAIDRAAKNEAGLLSAVEQLRRINNATPFFFKDRAKAITRLSKFAGTPVKIEYANDDAGAIASAKEIESVLKFAGWNVFEVPTNNLTPDFIGVLLKAIPHPNQLDPNSTAQGALNSEISQLGWPTSIINEDGRENVPSLDTVIVRIPADWRDPLTIWDAMQGHLTNRAAQINQAAKKN